MHASDQRFAKRSALRSRGCCWQEFDPARHVLAGECGGPLGVAATDDLEQFAVAIDRLLESCELTEWARLTRRTLLGGMECVGLERRRTRNPRRRYHPVCIMSTEWEAVPTVSGVGRGPAASLVRPHGAAGFCGPQATWTLGGGTNVSRPVLWGLPENDDPEKIPVSRSIWTW